MNFFFSKRPSFLIFPPAQGFGSFGDQAMLMTTIDRLYRKYPKSRIGILHYEKNDYFLNSYYPDLYNHHLFLQWERTNEKSVEQYKEILQNHDHVVFIGADVLDGAYNVEQVETFRNLIQITVGAGKKTTIIGFSYNQTGNLTALRYLKEISEITALQLRDSVSLERLENYGLQNLKLTADITFLFNHKSYKLNPKTAGYIKEINKKEKKKLIGLNISFNKNDNEKVGNFIKEFCKALVFSIDKEKYSLLLISHDIRDYPHQYSDTESLAMLEPALFYAGFTVHNPSWITTCVESKSLVSLCDFIIGNRMHLAVFSLSLGIPVISFIYQGKFEGLYRFYDFRHQLMFEKEKLKPDELSGAISYIQKNIKKLKRVIKSKNKKIIKLSKQNI